MSDLVKKADYNTNIENIEKKILNFDKYKVEMQFNNTL